MRTTDDGPDPAAGSWASAPARGGVTDALAAALLGGTATEDWRLDGDFGRMSPRAMKETYSLCGLGDSVGVNLPSLR